MYRPTFTFNPSLLTLMHFRQNTKIIIHDSWFHALSDMNSECVCCKSSSSHAWVQLHGYPLMVKVRRHGRELQSSPEIRYRRSILQVVQVVLPQEVRGGCGEVVGIVGDAHTVINIKGMLDVNGKVTQR